MPQPQASTVRIFFALWPQEAQRAQLSAVARGAHAMCGGRLMAHENLHLTLVFLGEVAADRIAEVTAFMDAVETPGFVLRFGTTGYWRHNRILWAAPYEVPPSVLALVAALQRQARAAGLRCEERPYTPHITLLRDARPPAALPSLDFDWQVNDYALVKSAPTKRGSRYEVIARGGLE